MNKVATNMAPDSTALSDQELELAQLIVETLNLEVQAADVDPLQPLYGDGLGLDSIDILETACDRPLQRRFAEKGTPS